MKDWSRKLHKCLSAENAKTSIYNSLSDGCSPLKRNIKDYVSAGYFNLDKPCNPSSHEVVAWVKRLKIILPLFVIYVNKKIKNFTSAENRTQWHS